MKEHEKAYPSDISEKLEIEFEEVMEITKHLIEEGIVGFVEDEKTEEEE